MKPKKSKFSFGPNGLKGFILDHVEKMILGVVLILVMVFAYMGSTVEKFPANKTVASLESQIKNATNSMEANTWPKVEAQHKPQSIADPIRIDVKPDPWRMSEIDPRILPSRQKRRDPKLYPVTNIEVEAAIAAIPLVPVEKDGEFETSPLDEKLKEAMEAASLPAPLPVEDTTKKKKKKTEAPGLEHVPVAPRGMVGGGVGPGGGRVLSDEDRDELASLGVRAGGTGFIAKSRNMVVFKALIPFKKQFTEYQDALNGNPAYFNEERDVPNYKFFYVQRADVTADPNAVPAEKDWQTLSTARARKLYDQPEGAWGVIPEELVDPLAIYPGLTLPAPPVLLADIKKLSGHKEIQFASAQALDPTRKDPKTDAAATTKPEGPETPESPDDLADPNTSNTPGQVRPGGPVVSPPTGPVRGGEHGGGYPRGGGYGPGYPSYGGSGGALGDQSVTYKLFRFVDFDVERGRKYRYRVKLVLEDPNHPQLAATAAGNVGPSDGGNTREPPPISLTPEVLQRLKDLATEEKEKGRRIWYRETEYSEPSPVIELPDTIKLASGAVTPGREIPLPSGNSRVALTEPVAKAMVVQWDDFYGVDVPGEQEDVQRGSVLNFKEETEVLHPLKFEFVKLKEYDFNSDALVVDIRGGDKLPGGDPRAPMTAPGEMALIDRHGNLVVHGEMADLALWQRHGKPKKAPEPEGTTGTEYGPGGVPYPSPGGIEGVLRPGSKGRPTGPREPGRTPR